MGKLSILASVVILAGTGGLLWAEDLNPQPLPPGRAISSGGDGNKLTASDKAQITGNLNGDGKSLDSTGEHFPKVRTAKAKGLDKSKAYMKYSKVKSSKTNKGFLKDGKAPTIGSATGGAGSGKAAFGDGSKTGNGFQKIENGFHKDAISGNSGTNQLPAVQKQ